MTPRLLTTAEAKAYLSGIHPLLLGAQPIGKGRGQRWDRIDLDARLDRRRGIEAEPAKAPANDETDEISALAERIANRASRRS